MGVIRIILIQLTALFSVYVSSYAAWNGPAAVLSGLWGSNTGQFSIQYGDTGDDFPKMFCLNSGGIIAIADEFNSRVQTYKIDGSYVASFGPQNIPELEGWKDGWPLRLACLSNSVYTEFDKYTQIYGITGSLIKNWDNLQGGLVGILADDNFITETSSAYFLYSPTGQLISTFTEEPLELGRVTENKLKSGKYRVTVKYPDKEWKIIGKGADPGYARDMNGNLYGYGERQVSRYDSCGIELALLTMPNKQMLQESRGSEVEPNITVLEEYGSPVIAPNGDVYTWKRTPDNYSIIKWTWTDDPNVPGGPDAPTNLNVTPAANGLSLAWKKSPQDPGCVEGYEVERSSTSGGLYSNLTTTAAGVVEYLDSGAQLGSTYFYRIRAKSSCGPSPYTAEISGKLP